MMQFLLDLGFKYGNKFLQFTAMMILPINSITAQSITDTTRVMELRENAKLMLESNPDSAIILCRQVYNLASSIGFKKGMERSKRTEGLGFEYKNMIDSALICYDEAIEIVRGMGLDKDEAEIVNFKGVALFYNGDYGKALNYYNKALQIQDSIGDLKGKSFTLNNIGIIYRRMKDHRKAIHVYEESYKIKKELGDSAGMGNSLHNAALAWSYLDEDSISISYFNKALQIFSELKLPEDYASSELALAQVYYNIGDNEKAEYYIDRCTSIIEKKRDIRYVTFLVYKGLFLIQRGENEEGLTKIRSGYDMIKGTDQYDLLRECERELYQAFRASGQIDSALVHLEELKQIDDLLTAEKREMLYKEMQTKFETSEKENTIKIQEVELAEKEQQKLSLYIAVAGAILLLLGAVTLILAKNRSNKLLSIEKSKAEKALSEKEILLKEIHHRVKNNLQVVSSLLSVQSRQINDPKALKAVSDSRNRVQSMALIHQNLYRDNDLTGVDMRDYIPKLCAELFSAYRIDEDIIELKTDINIRSLDVDTAIPLGLIINELITNSLKYAFENAESGLLEIKLKLKEDILVLEVNDDGKTEPELWKEGTGFGTKMINSFLTKLEGEMIVKTDKGRKVQLQIRKFKASA